MSYFGLEIPIDDGDRSQIERGVRTHRHPVPPSEGEGRPEYETGHSRLLGAGQPLPPTGGEGSVLTVHLS
jgi:hypothetical protein